jgi:hypothetical protein
MRYSQNTFREAPSAFRISPGLESSVTMVNGNEASIAEWDPSTVYSQWSPCCAWGIIYKETTEVFILDHLTRE